MTKSVLILISLLIGGIYLSAGTPINEQVAVSGMADSLSAELPLPAIPDSLRTPRKRAAYLLAHFWDSMSFADTLRSRNPGFMEQNLVNYLSLFPHALPQSLPSPVGRLLQRAAVDSVAFR